MTTINITRPLLVALAMTCVAALARADETQVTEHVTVHVARPTSQVIGRSKFGAPIELLQLSGRVSYADLELSIPSNAKVLKQRVHDAARLLCNDLDRMYPVTVSGDECTRKAEDDAMGQVGAAIASAEARKISSPM